MRIPRPVCCGALAVAAVLMVSGCGGTSPTRGTAAVDAGGVFLCPQTAPYEAYAGHMYPPNYPAPPPRTRRPAGCFSSAGAASRAGYPLAPPPPRVQDVGGVYLVPSARSLERLCRRAAVRSQLAVMCPRLIPGAPDDVFCPDPGAMCMASGSVVLEGTFEGPPGYVGAAPGSGHLWVIAFSRRSGIWPRDTLAGGTVVGRAMVRGRPGTWLSFPSGSDLNSGHIVLRWHEGGTTYAVSLHGRTGLNRRLVLAIAEHLTRVTA